MYSYLEKIAISFVVNTEPLPKNDIQKELSILLSVVKLETELETMRNYGANSESILNKRNELIVEKDKLTFHNHILENES